MPAGRTPEGEVKAVAGRDWESCITFNDGEWGYAERVPEDWYSARRCESGSPRCRSASSG